MATITNTGNGNWSSTTPDLPWAGGTLPGATDDVVIAAGTTVTADSDQTFGSSPAAAGVTLLINGKLDFGTVATAGKTLTISGGVTIAATGELSGDANGFRNFITINCGTTSLKYYFVIADGGKLTLTDTGADTVRYVLSSTTSSSGQAHVVVVGTTVATDWRVGDALILGKHVHNAGAVEKLIIKTLTVGATTTDIEFTTNLAQTHNAGIGVYNLTRGWTIQPANDTYKIGQITLANTGAAAIDCDNIFFRFIGDNSAGERGIDIASGFTGIFDNCSSESAGLIYMESVTGSYNFKNWTFYNFGGFGFVGSGSTNHLFSSCYFVYSGVFSSGNTSGDHFVDCIWDSMGTNGNFLGNGTMAFGDTTGCTYRGGYNVMLLYNGTAGYTSTNDTWGLGNTNAIKFGNGNFGQGTFINPTFTTGGISLVNPTPGSFMKIQKYDGISTKHYWYDANNGYMATCGAGLVDTLTKTTGQISLGLFPTAAAVLAESHAISKAVKANQRITIVGFFRKNSSYGAATLPSIKMTSQDGNINVTATLTNVDDTWVAFSLDGTVGAADTFITLTWTAQSANASAACYFADQSIIIGDPTGIASTAKIGTIWKNGEPTFDEWLGGTVSQQYLATVWDELKASHTASGSFGELPDDINNAGVIGGIIK